MKEKIRGKIIRIVNTTTVVINLGFLDGITEDNIFGILGEPESIVDPFTNEELGQVTLVKGRVKATTVSERFTIASSDWSEFMIGNLMAGFGATHHKEVLRVKRDEIKSWRAVSEDYVRVGDEVEVTVEQPDEDISDDGRKEDKKSDIEQGK